jgi:hypothetical protein
MYEGWIWLVVNEIIISRYEHSYILVFVNTKCFSSNRMAMFRVLSRCHVNIFCLFCMAQLKFSQVFRCELDHEEFPIVRVCCKIGQYSLDILNRLFPCWWICCIQRRGGIMPTLDYVCMYYPGWPVHIQYWTVGSWDDENNSRLFVLFVIVVKQIRILIREAHTSISCLSHHTIKHDIYSCMLPVMCVQCPQVDVFVH